MSLSDADNYNLHEFEHGRLVGLEAHRLAEQKMGSISYKLERIFVRGLRVTFGLAMVLGGLIIIGETEGLGDVPFAQLTLGMLVSHAIKLIFALGLIWWGFVAAFGASPNKSEVAKKFADQADAAVKAARDNARMNT